MSSGNSREKHEEKKHCPYPFRHALCALLFSRGAADGAKRPRGTVYVAALSATVGLVLFLIWALDQPFAGLIRVEPVAFHQVWSIID